MTGNANHHLTAISAHFGGAIVYDRDTPLFPRPLVVMVFTNRSGSNLLGDRLSSHPGIEGFRWRGSPAELLNTDMVNDIAPVLGARTFPCYLAALADAAQGRDAMLGVKASPEQLAMLLRCRIDRMFTGLRLLHMTREDLLGQAISMAIALATGQWDSNSPPAPNAAPAYDFQQLSNLIAMFRQSNIRARLLVEAFDLPCQRVDYESLTSDPERTVRRAMDWIGLDSGAWTIAAPRLGKQTSDLSHDFRARYLADIRRTTL